MANLGFTRMTVQGRNDLKGVAVLIKIGARVLDDILQEYGKRLGDVESVAVKRIVVTDMEALTGEQIEALQAGDMVVKRDETGDHSYRVSFKGATGICLTYSDCENVETIAYEKVEGEWTYDSKDVTPIAS